MKNRDAVDAFEAGRLAQLALDLMTGRAKLADVIGITDDELEALYVSGRRYYCCGQYEHAVTFFRFLCLHQHTDARYWFSLAAASQMFGDAENALHAYRVAALLNKQEPQIPLRAAECFIKLKQPAGAIGALADALALSAAKPGHSALAWRARRMLSRLKSEANSNNA
ncbi:SycD/LcrH family type III secretion system chaperone [Bradyrhizobium genosp. P]|uniref:SycD/LcrH family type III secretion system chaperone n=1 Tax=Bradyrhizobium genosp. P TaxID=83641 RepID=UPI003CEA83F4